MPEEVVDGLLYVFEYHCKPRREEARKMKDSVGVWACKNCTKIQKLIESSVFPAYEFPVCFLNVPECFLCAYDMLLDQQMYSLCMSKIKFPIFV